LGCLTGQYYRDKGYGSVFVRFRAPSVLLSRQPFVMTRHDFSLGADEFLDGSVADTTRLYETIPAGAAGIAPGPTAGLTRRRRDPRGNPALKLSLFEDAGAIAAA
jgi:hypothetical protein